MHALTAEERQQLKELIERRIEDAQDDIVSLDEATQPIEPDNAIGRLSRMDAIASKGVNEELLRKTRARLAMLERALQRIDLAQFGSCAVCGEAIPLGRLMAMPESTRCAKCTR